MFSFMWQMGYLRKGREILLSMFSKARKNRKGFTLVELLVVVAIIGILAAIAVPKFSSASESARGAKIQADLRTIDSAIQIYYASAGAYPAAIATLVPSLIATTPAAPTDYWSTPKAGRVSGGAYGISGGRATFSGSTVENF